VTALSIPLKDINLGTEGAADTEAIARIKAVRKLTMTADNKRNRQYLAAGTRRHLFGQRRSWQSENNTCSLSLSIQQDTPRFCCIALTNPTRPLWPTQVAGGIGGAREAWMLCGTGDSELVR